MKYKCEIQSLLNTHTVTHHETVKVDLNKRIKTSSEPKQKWNVAFGQYNVQYSSEQLYEGVLLV